MTKDRMVVKSMVSLRTGEPLVTLHWGAQSCQLTIAEAHVYAFTILEAAEAATTDAFLVTWAGKKLGLDEGRTSTLLQDFRAYRAERGGSLPPEERDSP